MDLRLGGSTKLIRDHKYMLLRGRSDSLRLFLRFRDRYAATQYVARLTNTVDMQGCAALASDRRLVSGLVPSLCH